jgi:hypothetical protein
MQIVALGDSITLECDALALPPPSYFWFLVDCNSNVVIDSISSGRGLRVARGNLTVEQAMRSHRGCYKCLANNSLEGSDREHITILKVSGKRTVRHVWLPIIFISLSPAPPLPPAMMSVAAMGPSWVTIDWTPVDSYPAIQYYELEYSLGDLLSDTIEHISPTSDSVNFSMLYPSATYTVRVRAKSPFGRGNYSPVVMATTLEGVPQDGLVNGPEPQGIRIFLSPNNITVSWTVPEVSLSPLLCPCIFIQ